LKNLKSVRFFIKTTEKSTALFVFLETRVIKVSAFGQYQELLASVPIRPSARRGQAPPTTPICSRKKHRTFLAKLKTIALMCM